MSHSGTLIVDILATVDLVSYASYREQRRRFPETTPERWAKIYPQGELFEKWFQQEQREAREAKHEARLIRESWDHISPQLGEEPAED
jgi:hypothetical protein